MGESSVAPRLIDSSQRRRIFAIVRELGLTDEQRHEEAEKVVEKGSLSASAEHPMTYIEAAKVEQHFIRLSAEHRKTRGKQHRRRNAADKSPVSSEHLDTINRLGGQLFGRDDEGQRRLRTWIKRKWSVDAPRFLPPKDATSCLQALRSMQRRGWKPNKEGV